MGSAFQGNNLLVKEVTPFYKGGKYRKLHVAEWLHLKVYPLTLIRSITSILDMADLLLIIF